MSSLPLTPNDIYNKEFPRALRGYREDEVDDFLDQVVQDYENFVRERDLLREQNDSLRKRLEEFDSLKENMQKALVMAEKAADEVRDSARREAEVVLREAKAKSEQMIEEAHTNLSRFQQRYQELRQEVARYRAQTRSSLESILRMLAEERDAEQAAAGGEA